MVRRPENDAEHAEREARDAKADPATSAAPFAADDEEAVDDVDEKSPLLQRFAALHTTANKERLAFAFVMSVAAGVVLPFLGATGFFDPWETNYAEVARQMAQRDDYLYPFWKDAYFFSKPILLFWLTAPLYALVGAGSAERELPALVELVGRLPIALFALLMVAIVTVTARRLFGLRAAVLTGLALSTMPYFDFIARQAITDMLYVAPMSSAICLLALAFFDDEGRDHMKASRLPTWLVVIFALTVLPQMWEIGRTAAFLNRVEWLGTEHATRLAASIGLSLLVVVFFVVLAKKARDPLLHAAAALLALATLGKGPHAVALTVLPFLIYFVATSEWSLLKRPAIFTASLLYLAIASPWVIVMLLFTGKDDGQKTWFMRFVVYDLFGRLGGVHGERGTFEYYVRYLAYGMFPWAPLFPIALLDAAARRLKPRGARTVEERATLFVLIWAISYFTFFTVTETKFHHYIFPVVVPAAFLIGRWLDRLVAGSSRLPIGIGIVIVLATVIIGRDLASQPWQLVDLFSYHYVSYKPDYYFPPTPFFRVVLGGLALTIAIVLCTALVSDRLYGRRREAGANDVVGTDKSWLSRVDGLLGSSSWAARVAFVVTIVVALVLFVIALLDVGANVEQLKTLRQRWVLRAFWFIALGVAIAVANVVSLVVSSRSSSGGADADPHLLWPARIGRTILAGRGMTTNAGFVAMLCACAVLSSIVLVHVYMANLSPHWSHRWLLKTYWSMSAPGEPLISYQMDWKGETFYAHNTEIQIKKDAAALKKAIEKPGREFILVQQDRFNRVKSAVSASHAEHIRVVDRSNQKWFLLVADDPPPKAKAPAPETSTAPE